MIKAIINEGLKKGFSTTEVYREHIKKEIFESFIDYHAHHRVDLNCVSVRAFWDYGDPLGFSIVNPGLKTIRRAFTDLYAIQVPEKKPTFSHHLPRDAKKIPLNIYDETVETLDQKEFVQLQEQVSEITIRFAGLQLNKIQLNKFLKKVYLANSFGLNIKYRKSVFDLVLNFIFKGNSLEIRERVVQYKNLEPLKIISRAANLLSSLTESHRKPGDVNFLIFAPEVSAYLLKEFSPYFKLDSHQHLPEMQFPQILNVVDDPLLEARVGSIPFDDEGIQARETYIIKQGVFTSLVSDIATAFQHERLSTGNGFRNPKTFFPSIQFTNLFIKPTVLPLKNLMNDAGSGILVVLAKLKYIENTRYFFSGYGYSFKNQNIMEPVHIYFSTTFPGYFLKVKKISKEIKFFFTEFNIGSPYMLLDVNQKSPRHFEI